jgi:hypothetical protein
MCTEYGTCCLFCRNGWDHPETAPPPPRRGEFWRKHDSLALEISEKQVATMDKHYAKHGIRLGHKRSRDGKGFVPDLREKRDFDRCLRARGMVDMG